MYNRRKGGDGNGRDRRQKIREDWKEDIKKRRKERKKHENKNCETMA